MMFGYGYGGPGGWLWMMGGLIVLVGIVLLVVWAFGVRRTRPDDGRPTPLEILRERYARGDITEEQFEQAKQTLGRR